MLKTESKAKLWRIATNNIYFGGSSALVIAKRMRDSEGQDIVSAVYSVSAIQPNPYKPQECKYCGCNFIPAESECKEFCSAECANDYFG